MDKNSLVVETLDLDDNKEFVNCFLESNNHFKSLEESTLEDINNVVNYPTKKNDVFLKIVKDIGQNSKFYSGFQVVGSQLRPLPIGSFLDTKRGIFYWHPGPGFIGNYELVFIVRGKTGNFSKWNITVKIR